MDKTKNHLHLLDRIKGLNDTIIEKMSPEVMMRVTDGFDESLVKNVIYIGTTNYDQRKIIKAVKKKYKEWNQSNNFLWIEDYPEFIKELETDIECGYVVTANGSYSEGQATLNISLVPSNAVQLKPFPEVVQQAENMSDDNMDKGKDHDTSRYATRIKELDDENKRLKKVLELDKVLEDDNMRLQIDERIIFVSTALGVPWNSGMTNQTQLAKIIEHFSGDSYKSIRSRIVTINKEIKEENKNPGEGLSQGTKEAVNNVIGWLSKATNSKLNTPATDKMIKDIKDVFLNSLE